MKEHIWIVIETNAEAQPIDVKAFRFKIDCTMYALFLRDNNRAGRVGEVVLE
jgi:hypothetical protein